MSKVVCHTLKGGAGHGVAPGQTELAPPPYSPPFRGGVRVGQERVEGEAVEPAGRLAQLAAQAERLSVSHRDPEAFFIERSEIANELRAVARVLPAFERAGRLRRGALLATPILDTKVRT